MIEVTGYRCDVHWRIFLGWLLAREGLVTLSLEGHI